MRFILLIIIILLGLFILTTKPKRLEGLDATVATESLQTLASMYNSGNATLTSLKLTGDLDAGMSRITSGNSCLNASNGWTYCWIGGLGGASGSADSLDLHFYQNGAWKANPMTFGPDGSVRVNNTNLQVNGRNIISELNNLNGQVASLNATVADLRNNAIRKDRAYAIQSQGAGRGGYLPDHGGWVPSAGDPAARMMFVQL